MADSRIRFDCGAAREFLCLLNDRGLDEVARSGEERSVVLL